MPHSAWAWLARSMFWTSKTAYHSMPMKFTKSSLLQMLLGSGNIVAFPVSTIKLIQPYGVLPLGQVLDDLVSGPASIENFGLGVREAPLQVGNGATVSGLLAQVVGILKIQLVVCAACRVVSVQFHSRRKKYSPRIGPPFPFPSMGWPCAN